ncbi:hypothetical protein PG985_001800 [Apiospora marii]|uniref:uncharacterized protein n=1 Tax=Apiospora marii TaxID=335849 RepID=UPI00312FEBC1
MDLCGRHLKPDLFNRSGAWTFRPPEEQAIRNLKIAIATHTQGRGFSFDIQDATESSFSPYIEQSKCGLQSQDKPDPSLEMFFISRNIQHTRFNVTQIEFSELIEFIGLNPVLVAFAHSGTTCFRYITGEHGCHSFYFKGMGYTLAWTFDTRTMKTRALLDQEHDAYGKQTTSFIRGGAFDIPGLSEHHLYHPLPLALLILIDIIFQCQHNYLRDGSSLPEIEAMTRFARSFAPIDATPPSYDDLYKAAMQVTRIQASCSSLNRSLYIAVCVVEVFDTQHESQFALFNNSTHPRAEDVMDRHRSVATSLRQGARVIKSELGYLSFSSQQRLVRAKAQSDIVLPMAISQSAQEMARDNRRDTVVMKGIGYLTLLFLPGTFFSTLFSMPSLGGPGLVSEQFWVFWICTIPTTIIVWAVFDWCTNRYLRDILAHAEIWRRDTDNHTP